jgi:hypothetical protein
MVLTAEGGSGGSKISCPSCRLYQQLQLVLAWCSSRSAYLPAHPPALPTTLPVNCRLFTSRIRVSRRRQYGRLRQYVVYGSPKGASNQFLHTHLHRIQITRRR